MLLEVICGRNKISSTKLSSDLPLNRRRSELRPPLQPVWCFWPEWFLKYTHFWAGNIAVGNLQHFLPVIVKMVETDSQKRLLSLHALKEVSLCEGVNTIETHAYMVFRWWLTAPMVNWKLLPMYSGYRYSKTQRIQRRLLATLRQRV